MKARTFELVDGLVKLHQLLLCEIAGFSIRVGQMGHEPFQLKGCWEPVRGYERRQFTLCEAQSSHPGFHLEVNWIGYGKRCGGLSQRREQRWVTHDRGQLVHKKVGNLLVKQRAEDDDRGIDAGLSEYDAFLNGNHRHARDTEPDQCFGCFDGPMAVSVCFDDGHDVASGRQDATELSEIMSEGCEIDCSVGW